LTKARKSHTGLSGCPAEYAEWRLLDGKHAAHERQIAAWTILAPDIDDISLRQLSDQRQ
jgi:hypothetical protein